MKVWIHQIKDAMAWQERNYKLLQEEWMQDPTEDKLHRYIESYGTYRQLKGQYEQWHTDYKEFKETGEL